MTPESRQPTRLGLVALSLLTACLAGALDAGAARIILDIDDPPNSGFNSTQRVTPVAGNPLGTLGEQRVRAFEAAARAFERRLVSNVEIRVSASWDSFECDDDDSAAIASAGPTFVWRNFPGAPRVETYYSIAPANAIFGADVVPTDPHIRIRFSHDVGVRGCVSDLRWNYSIGEAVTTENHLSFVIVAQHELAHGLGFTNLVDISDGKLFNGVEDIYSIQLEDHSKGKLWSEMNNNERRISAADVGDLHWTGGAVQARAYRLHDGTDPDSGHVQMQTEESVSHFSRAAMGAGFSEVMRPSFRRDSDLLLTPELLQDVGWGVDSPRVGSLSDVDGNGVPDLAVGRIDRASGALSTVVFDPSTGAYLTRTKHTRGYAAIDLAVVPSFGSTAADEVALLARDRRQGSIQAFVTDAGSGELLATVGFDPQFTPLRLAVVPSFGGSPADELAVLSLRAADEATRILIKDASSGQAFRTLAFQAGYLPIDMAVVPDLGGSPAAELAALVRRPSQGQQGVFVRDSASGAVLSFVQLPADFHGRAITALDDFADSDAPEIAVAGVDAIGLPQIRVYDGRSGVEISAFDLAADLDIRGIGTLADFDDTPASEILVMGKQVDDRAARLYVHDASSGTRLYRLALPAQREGVALAALPDWSSTPASEVALLVSTVTDFRYRVYVDDPASGLRLATADVPFDSELPETAGLAPAANVVPPAIVGDEPEPAEADEAAARRRRGGLVDGAGPERRIR